MSYISDFLKELEKLNKTTVSKVQNTQKKGQIAAGMQSKDQFTSDFFKELHKLEEKEALKKNQEKKKTRFDDPIKTRFNAEDELTTASQKLKAKSTGTVGGGGRSFGKDEEEINDPDDVSKGSVSSMVKLGKAVTGLFTEEQDWNLDGPQKRTRKNSTYIEIGNGYKLNKNNFNLVTSDQEIIGKYDPKTGIIMSKDGKKYFQIKEDGSLKMYDGAKELGFDTGGANDSWFQAGAFEDGFDWYDIPVSVVATGRELGKGAVKGFLNLGENFVDSSVMVGSGMMTKGAELLGLDGGFKGIESFAEQFIAKDIINEDAIADVIVPDMIGKLSDYDSSELAVVGRKGSGAAEGVGQLGAQYLATLAGVPAWLVSGVYSFGSEAENAFKQDASFSDTFKSASITAAAEMLTEKIFGQFKFQGKALDDGLRTLISRNIENKALRAAAMVGLDRVGEGVEEVLSDFGSALGQKATYASDKELKELFSAEDAFDSFLGGVAVSFAGSLPGRIKSKVNGVDSVTGLTKNEQAVVDKVYKDEVAEAEKDGKKLDGTEKNKLYDRIRNDLQKGYISTDAIEEVLGGDTYKQYKDAIDSENAAVKELEGLYEGDELEQQKKSFQEHSKLDSIREQLGNEVAEKVKGDRLIESYNEKIRRKQLFTADLTKYSEKSQAVVQKAIDSGVVSNTNRSHEFVDFVAKVAGDTGIDFDFVNNKKLKESGFAIEGATINGFRSENGVTLNVQSKKALNSVVGHEITHVLEGTKLYNELQKIAFEYAEMKGEYKDRLRTANETYKNVEGYQGVDGYNKIKSEVLADIIGDYLFTDADFVKNLSANHRNVFQKIYDEIKYLYKVATAGSKEARELEKLKKVFEDNYRNTNVSNDASAKTQYSISETTDGRKVAVVDNDILSDINTENWDKATKKNVQKATAEELKKFTGGFTINGIEYIDNQDSRREYTRSNYSETLARKNPDAYLDKMRAATILDDVIQVATDWKNDGSLTHSRTDFVDFVRGKILIKSGDRTYRAIVLAGITKDGKAIFHDVEDVYPEHFEIKKMESSTAVSANEMPNNILEDSIADTVAQKKDSVKPQYSLSTDSDGKKLSKEQQEFFKDSKVVDADGNLRVVYHGTFEDFTVFDIAKTSITNAFGEGHYFTSHQRDAQKNYASVEGADVRTKIESLAWQYFEEMGYSEADYESNEYVAEWNEAYDKAEAFYKSGKVMQVYLNITNPLYAGQHGELYNSSNEEVTARSAEELKKLGYDGIIDYYVSDRFGRFQDLDAETAHYIVFDSNQIKLTTNTDPTPHEDIRFSLSKTVEETKDLVALHNLTATKLLKSLELGGLPMPSIAITKSSIPHDNFGEITLILGKDSIDPKANRKNVAYSADAWTPTFPQVEYETDKNVERQIDRKITDLMSKVDDVFHRDLQMLMYGYEDTLNRNDGEEGLVQYAMGKYGLKAAYLEEQGHHIEKITKQVEEEKKYNPASIEKYQKVLDVLGVSSATEIGKLNLRDTIEQYGEALEAVYPGSTKSAMRMGSILRQVQAYIESHNSEPVYHTVTDEAAMRKEIDNALDIDGFEQWVRNLYSGIVKDRGIYNNKDLFTPSGNRKSFKQTHLPFTLENIVKAMASQNNGNTKNVSGFNGIKTLRAGTAEKFKSIQEMHDRKGRLQHLTQEQADKINEDLSARLYAIMEAVDNESGKSGSSNPFIRFDSIGETLMEISEGGKYNVADIQRVFAQYNRNISDDTATNIKQLLFDVSQMPVNIFEAKPERAVSFDEVGVFVIPRNADAKLKQELLNRGYAIAEYDPNVEGDRNRVVNQFEEYKFSLSNNGEAQKTYGNYNIRSEDVAFETAPAQNDIAPTAETVTQETTAQENLFPDDLAPVQNELATLQRQVEQYEDRMIEAVNAGDYSKFNRLNAEYEPIRQRYDQLKAEDDAEFDERMSSITDEDAPPDIAPDYVQTADNIPITKKLADDIAREVRSSLALSNKDMADVRSIISEFNAQETPSRDDLFHELRDRFGTYSETQTDDTLAEAKSVLRSFKISVDDFIKSEIADYGDLVKRNFGKVRFSKEGTSVDSAYEELASQYPHLFPEDIISPTDQLMQIIDVANMDTSLVSEQRIDDESILGVADTIIDRLSAYKNTQREKTANKLGREAFDSLLEDDSAVPPVDLDGILRNKSRAERRSGTSGDIAPTSEIYDTQHKKGVVEGQQAMWNDPVPESLTRKILHERIIDNMKNTVHVNGFELDDVLKNAKNLSTFATVDNTPQRVMDKTFGYKAGGVLADMTVNKVAQNETEGIKWLNSFTDRKSGLLAQISKQYNIKPGSKQSAAAQMYAEGFYVGENNEIIRYGDAELAQDFPDKQVQKNIKGLARDPRIRQIYDDTLAMINESRKRNAFPEIPRLDNYFLHFRAMDDTFSRLGLPFNPNDIRAKDLPTDLNGVTADLKPGQPYFASAMHREGKRTSFDLLGGLEKYLNSAKNQIYHIDDIQNLRALRNYIADTYGQANGLDGLDALSEEEQQDRIEQVYGSHLSTFAKFLNEEANVLAGKTALIDRGLEGIIGRRGITFLNSLNRQVGSNLIGGNISSALTNFDAVARAFAKSNKGDFIKAFAQTTSNKVSSIFGKNDGFADSSPVIIRRKGAESFYRTPWQKISDPGYILMSAVDNISTELIARTKYNELTKKGMDSQKAHIETDKWVSRLMGDRSLGQQPQLYNSKMLGLITKFQLEVRNNLDSNFYDTIQEAKVSNEEIQNKLARNAKTAAKVTSTFVQLAVAQHLFGKAFESVAGYNPAFDIIDVIIKTFGWDDEEEDEDTVLDNIEEGFLALLEDLPYTSTFTGGRIPISSALPINQLVTGKDDYGNEKPRWETALEALPYYIMPGGYGQAKKTAKGLSMFSDEHPTAGSYTDSGGLRFPVEDTLGNRIKAGVFGQWAFPEARDYIDNERKPLDEKQTQEFIDADMPYADYRNYRDGLSKVNASIRGGKLGRQADYINSLDLPVRTKNLLINNLTDRKDPIDLTDYSNYADFEEFDFAQKNPEKYEFLKGIGVSVKDYNKADEETKNVYSWAYKYPEKHKFLEEQGVSLTDWKHMTDSSKDAYMWAYENPEKRTVAKAVASDVVEYRKYTGELYDIKADKDRNGKSISGSRKTKVAEYISGLDIDDGAKYILFKSEYPSDDTYNYEIIDYLNRRDDISFEEMNTILTELGFKVTKEGKITWD